MIAFLGGTIGNFDRPAESPSSAGSQRCSGPQDTLLLGTDLVKDRARLEAAYNDSAGVTARFNKNVLTVLNRELDADFDLDAFEHLAFYDRGRERIDIRLRSLADQRVAVRGLDLEVDFARGEEMRTELSCKFTRASLERAYDEAGLAWSSSGPIPTSSSRSAWRPRSSRPERDGRRWDQSSRVPGVSSAQQGENGADAHHEASSVAFDAVGKTYRGADAPAVSDLSLEVPAGEICVLVGPSGCGKTTAMRMVNRTVEITEGDITIGGRSVRDRAAGQLRREIGYVIQQIGLFPHRTIGENIATVPGAARLGGGAPPAAGRRAAGPDRRSTPSSPTATRRSSPAASSSGSASPGRWRPTRR